ncbi:hypothetical protein H0H10_14420 [Streptomyces sp. TRM S81-3]|uniref:Uncharacterized protein n=1 Tax=Streptomyces griseicoloratus TaxID=2752516 RepID=A0A926QRV8_9ACTN|nr:hypothetical protein [Streptomyces griseicoloratus]MBD0420322.1 hypothetical protein [Streptomyces griseicoloratus]
MSSGLLNRFVNSVAGGHQRKSYPEEDPVLLTPAGGGEGVEVRQAVLGAALVEVQVGQIMEDPVVPVAGVGLVAHHLDRFVPPAVQGRQIGQLLPGR